MCNAKFNDKAMVVNGYLKQFCIKNIIFCYTKRKPLIQESAIKVSCILTSQELC